MDAKHPREPGPASTNGRAPRMSKSARREQLLDVAAQLLIQHGAQAVTMERLAEWAGVSKALPYAHFDNSNAVLLALRDRETARVAGGMWEAGAAAEDAERVSAIVRSSFDEVEHSADLLGVLTGPGAIVADDRDKEERLGVRFVTALLTEHFGLDRQSARSVAPVLLGAFIGAAEGWGAGDADRETTELMAHATLTALLATVPLHR